MNKKSVQWTLAILMIFLFAGTTVQASEIIYKSDLQNMVVSNETVVKTADNVIFLVDTSESMAAMNKTHSKSFYELEKAALKTGFERLPDLGYNVGVYRFTPWEVIYPMQKFNAAKAEDALNKLPAQAAGDTPLVQGLNELGTVLQNMSGKTYVYIFTDGGYDKAASTTSPGDIATELAKKYNVCFQIVDYAFQPRNVKTVSDMSRANTCSRTISFDSYVDQPYYAISPLYYAKQSKYNANPILFGIDKYDLSPTAKKELDGIGKFLVEQPKSFVVLFGYTDDTGKPGYNMELSRRRAEAAADYLEKDYNLRSDRVVANWYGAANPVASNGTTAGRSQNRRVELGIGEM